MPLFTCCCGGPVTCNAYGITGVASIRAFSFMPQCGFYRRADVTCSFGATTLLSYRDEVSIPGDRRTRSNVFRNSGFIPAGNYADPARGGWEWILPGVCNLWSPLNLPGQMPYTTPPPVITLGAGTATGVWSGTSTLISGFTITIVLSQPIVFADLEPYAQLIVDGFPEAQLGPPTNQNFGGYITSAGSIVHGQVSQFDPTFIPLLSPQPVLHGTDTLNKIPVNYAPCIITTAPPGLAVAGGAATVREVGFIFDYARGANLNCGGASAYIDLGGFQLAMMFAVRKKSFLNLPGSAFSILERTVTWPSQGPGNCAPFIGIGPTICTQINRLDLPGPMMAIDRDTPALGTARFYACPA